MAMVTLIDRPDRKIEVRDDLAHKYEICPFCNGHPTKMACVGASLYGNWRLYQEYLSCDCGSGIRVKPGYR